MDLGQHIAGARLPYSKWVVDSWGWPDNQNLEGQGTI